MKLYQTASYTGADFRKRSSVLGPQMAAPLKPPRAPLGHRQRANLLRCFSVYYALNKLELLRDGKDVP